MVKSSKPKKQRKSFFNRALHLKGKNFAAHLSKELRKSLGKRSLQLRKGDKVKVMSGSNKGFSGKIIRVNRRKNQVFLEKLNRKKADGTEIPLPLKPSNLLLVELDKSDEKRVKQKAIKKVEKGKEEKPEKKEDGKEEKGVKEGEEVKEEVKKGEGKKEVERKGTKEKEEAKEEKVEKEEEKKVVKKAGE